MEDITREKLIDHLTTDKAIEYYTALAGRKATKTDCRQLAGRVIPYMLDQLDSKASKDTKIADKLHEYMGQSFTREVAEDPQFGSTVMSILLGTKKAEIIGTNADDMLVHPFVIENMMIAMAPMVMRAYGNEYGKDVFMNGFPGPGLGRMEPMSKQPAPPEPAPMSKQPAPPKPESMPKQPAPVPKAPKLPGTAHPGPGQPTGRRPEGGMRQSEGGFFGRR